MLGAGLSVSLNLYLSLFRGLAVSVRRGAIRSRTTGRGGLGLPGCGLLLMSLSLTSLGLGLGRLLLLRASLSEALVGIAPFDLALVCRGGLRLHRRPFAGRRLGIGLLGGLLVLERLLTLCGGEVACSRAWAATECAIGLAAI